MRKKRAQQQKHEKYVAEEEARVVFGCVWLAEAQN